MNILNSLAALPPNARLATRLGVLALALGVSPASHAQGGLADAVAAAYARQGQDRLVEKQQAVGQHLEQRAAQPFSADPAFNLKYQTDAIGSGDGYREWEGGVDLPLWSPGQRSATSQEARQMVQMATAVARAKRLDIAGEVRERLWTVALARSAQREALLAYETAQRLQADVRRRVEAGELPRSNLLLAQEETLVREDELRQAENRVRQAEQLFRAYTGMADVPDAEPEAPDATTEISADHPVLALAEAKVGLARARRDRIATERYSGTSLWLGGKSVRDTSVSSYKSSVGVEITVPLGSQVQRAPAVAESEAALTEAILDRQRSQRELQGKLAAARLEYERAESALTLAGQRKSIADESLRLTRRAFELGEIDLIRLLQARRDAIAARAAYERRRVQLGQAIARFNQTAGVIPQ